MSDNLKRHTYTFTTHVKLKETSTNRCFVPSLVKFGPEVLHQKIFKVCQCIFAISLLSSHGKEKGVALYLNKFESPPPKNALCQVWMKLAQWSLRRRFFLSSSIYFNYFLIFSTWKRVWPFIWKKLESPSPKDALCQVWLKSALTFLRRFLTFINVYLLFPYYLPLEKDVALHLNKLESPLPKNGLCQFWGKLAQWFWRRRRTCEKFMTTTTTTTTTDNGQILIRKAHLSFRLR